MSARYIQFKVSRTMNQHKLSALLVSTLSVSLLLSACNLKPEPEPESEPKAKTHHSASGTNTEDVAPIGHSQTQVSNIDSTAARPKFDIKVEDYAKTINRLLANTEFAGNTFDEVIEGEYDNAFVIDYPQRISLTGEVSESGWLQKLTYTMPSDQQLERSGHQLLQLVSASMQALNPDLSESEADSKVASLLDQAVSNFIMENTQQRAVGVVNDSVYVCEISEMGVRVLIEPAEGSRYVH